MVYVLHRLLLIIANMFMLGLHDSVLPHRRGTFSNTHAQLTLQFVAAHGSEKLYMFSLCSSVVLYVIHSAGE